MGIAEMSSGFVDLLLVLHGSSDVSCALLLISKLPGAVNMDLGLFIEPSLMREKAVLTSCRGQ